MSEQETKLIAVEKDGGKVSGTFSVPIMATGELVPNNFMSTQASVLNKYEPSGTVRYNSNDTPVYDVKGIPSKFADQVRLARKYYSEEPITGTVIDVLTQFSVSEIEHIVDDEEIKEFYDALYHETSNLHQIVKNAYLDYYIACNVWPVRSDKGPKVVTRSGKKIPEYKWTILNPENVDIQGTLLFDQSLITVKPNEELKEIIKSKDPAVRKLIDDIPPAMKLAIEKGGNIPIDPDKVYHIARNKQPFQRTAIPFIMRNVGPLRVKQKLMEMDLSTADGVINQLVTVTIGNDDHPATQEELEKLAEIIRTPSKAYALIWNHTLSVKIHPPEANLFDPKKYEQVNRDISAGYGIARPVVADGGTYASQTVSVQSLIQWLEWGREDIKHWLEHEYKLIAKENGLKTYPRVRFKKVSLSEEKLIKNILMGLYDRGIISVETLSRETGHDIDVEESRQKREMKLKKKGLFVPQSPWQQSKDPKKPSGNDGPGRPDESPEDGDRDNRDDTPAPHGASLKTMASLTDKREEFTKDFKSLYVNLKDRLLSRLSLSNDREIRDDIIDAALIAFSLDLTKLSNKFIESSFDVTYKEITGDSYQSNSNAQVAMQECQLWNLTYTDKLSNDLSRGVKKGLSFDESVDSVVESVFESNAYRTDLFGEEVIKKAGFFGEVAGMKTSGYNRGYWNATFERTCEECTSRHGQVYSMEELLEIFPAHNHCRCFIDWAR